MEATQPRITWLEERNTRWDEMVEWAGERGERITPEVAMKTSAYMACARVVAETVASMPLHLYRRLGEGENERARDLPLYDVLSRRPNGWQTRYEWVEQGCLHLGFYGSWFNLKVPGERGAVSELWPLHPSGMRVEQEDDKTLTYLYRDPKTARQVVYRDDQIMHVRWLSFDGVNGAVPVDIGKDAIGLARSLEQYASTFYKNNAQPGVLLHTDQALPREVREQLREQWESAHRGPARAGRTAILSNGLKADTISATNQESQLAELWMQSLLAVCRIWRMPPHMVQELGRATWGNLASEMVSFEKFTIQPWLRRIEGAIDRDILPAVGTDYYAEFLVEGLLRSDITTRFQAYEIAIRNGWMTKEEVRQKENLPPLPLGAIPEPPQPQPTPDQPPEDTMPQGTASTTQRSVEELRFDPDQPRADDGKWASGGGSGGGGLDSVGGSGTGAGNSVGGDKQSSTPQQKQRKERLRDKIEGTQAEANREVTRADQKIQKIQKQLDEVKAKLSQAKDRASQAQKVQADLLSKARAEKESKISAAKAKYEAKMQAIATKYGRK